MRSSSLQCACCSIIVLRFLVLKVSPDLWKGQCYSAAVDGMVTELMGTALPVKFKPVSEEGGNYFARGELAEVGIVDRHGSYGHCHLRNVRNVYLVAWLFRYRLPMLAHAVHHHLNHFPDVLHRFVASCTVRSRTLLNKGGAIRMPAVIIGLDDYFERVRFHLLRDLTIKL